MPYESVLQRLVARTERMAEVLAAKTGEEMSPALIKYALLTVATDTPVDRAVADLVDCGSADNAVGRLLIGAAEQHLRARGEGAETYSRGAWPLTSF